MTRHPTWAILAAALVLAACGGDDGSADGGPTTGVTARGDEFSFEPSSWTVPADTPVEVRFENVGAIEHNFVVLGAGITIAEELEYSEGMAIFELPAVRPGEAETGVIAVPAATYQVICSIPGHFDAGMEGTLVAAP